MNRFDLLLASRKTGWDDSDPEEIMLDDDGGWKDVPVNPDVRNFEAFAAEREHALEEVERNILNNTHRYEAASEFTDFTAPLLEKTTTVPGRKLALLSVQTRYCLGYVRNIDLKKISLINVGMHRNDIPKYSELPDSPPKSPSRWPMRDSDLDSVFTVIEESDNPISQLESQLGQVDIGVNNLRTNSSYSTIDSPYSATASGRMRLEQRVHERKRQNATGDSQSHTSGRMLLQQRVYERKRLQDDTQSNSNYSTTDSSCSATASGRELLKQRVHERKRQNATRDSPSSGYTDISNKERFKYYKKWNI